MNMSESLRLFFLRVSVAKQGTSELRRPHHTRYFSIILETVFFWFLLAKASFKLPEHNVLNFFK